MSDENFYSIINIISVIINSLLLIKYKNLKELNISKWMEITITVIKSFM